MTARLIDAHTVSEMTGISAWTLRRMARQGRIPARKIGQRTWFVPTEIEAWLDKLPKAAS